MSNPSDVIQQAGHHDNRHAHAAMRGYFVTEPPAIENQTSAKVPTKKVRTWMLVLLAFGVCFFLVGVTLMTRSTKRPEFHKPEFVAGSVLLGLALASFLLVAVLCFYHRRRLCDENILGTGHKERGCGIENPSYYLPMPTHRIKTRLSTVNVGKDNIPTTSGIGCSNSSNDQCFASKRRNTSPV